MSLTGSVRGRVLRLAVLLLLPCLSISALLAWRVSVTAGEGARTALLATARGLDQLVDGEFASAELLLRTLAATDELRSGRLADFDRLARAAAPPGSTIMLADGMGRELVDTGRPGGERLPSAPLAGAARAAAGHVTVSPLILAAETGALSVHVQLHAGEIGQPRFGVTLVLPAASLQRLLARQRLPAGWDASIIDPAGTTVAGTRQLQLVESRHAGGSLLGGPAQMDGVRDGYSEGTPVLAGFSRSAGSGWAVVVAAPRSLVGAAGRQAAILILWLGAACLVLGLAAAWYVARGIARPVAAMAQVAQKLAEGGGWTAVPQGLEEADAVAGAMFLAFQFLIERRETMDAANLSLANRVEARTGELARANTALNDQRRQLEEILNHMPVGVVVHHADGRLRFVNQAARRLLRLALQGRVEPSDWPVIHRGARVLDAQDQPSARAREGVPVEREALTLQGGDRPPVELEVNASPLLGQDGKVSLAVTTMQDVTARLEAEEARRRSQRLEAVGQLTGGVAHEFNNLLMAISGCLELLSAHVEGAFAPDSRPRTLLANAQRAAGRGAGLTGQLLAFSRRQHLLVEPVDLNALVSGMSQLLEGTLGRLIQVEVMADPDVWPAMADASQLELVLLNLAINARDAMPAGGRLTIRTGSVVTGPPFRAEDPPAGEHAVLHVSDTGHGMAPHVLARVFEPFFTTKDVGRGSGLGLPHVLGVAQQLGGGVSIVSRTGQGTTVSLFLPRAHGSVSVPRPAVAWSPAGRALAGTRLLLVDDDADVREITRSMLEEMGAEVIEADNGASALLLLRTGRVDLILADLTMPKMTGIELAAEAASLFPGLPVVLMTGYGPATMGDAGPHVRATLRKPFRADALAQILSAELRLADVAD